VPDEPSGPRRPPPPPRRATGKSTAKAAGKPKRQPKPKARTETAAKSKTQPASRPQGGTRSERRAEKNAQRPGRRRAAMRTALVAVVAVGLLFAFVYPTRTYLDQRSQTNKARAQLDLLHAENAQLTKDAKKLSSDAEIEQLARERYGLVKPGEKSFVVLPSPTTAPPTTAPPTTTPPDPATTAAPDGATPGNAP